MKDEKDFDNAVKAKLESRVYTPNENSWAAAEKLITEQEAAGRSGFGKYIAGLFVAMGVLAVTGWFLLHKPEGKNKTTADAAGQADTQINTESNSALSDVNTTADADASGTSTRPNGEFNAPQNMNNNPGKTSQATPGTNENPVANNASVNPGKIPATAGGNNYAGAAENAPKTKRGGKKTAPGATAAGTVSANTTAAGQQSPTATSAYAVGATTADAAGQTPTVTSVEQDVRTSGTLTNRTSRQPGSDNESTGDGLASGTAVKDAAAEPIAAKPVIAVTTQQTNEQESLTGTVKTGSSTSITSTTDPSGYWFVRGGFSYMPGFEAATTLGRSINPIIGGGYNFGLGKKIRLEAGLHYTTIGKAADSSRIYSSQSFSFGLEQQRTEIGLQRLHYVAMPIQLHIALNYKNTLLAGITPHYLFTAESRVRTYTLSQSTITNDNTTRMFGYNQGLRKTDLLLGAGYVRRISDRLDVSAQFNFGLFDIKDNAYFGFEKTERHKNLQLLLLYKF